MAVAPISAGARRAKELLVAGTKSAAASGITEGPLFTYITTEGFWPANNQIWFVAKTAAGAFDPNLMDDIAFGNTPAPKGHYILDAFDRNPDAVSKVPGIAPFRLTTAARPSCVCSYAGRIFYAGIGELGYQDRVYFSMVVRDYLDLNRCYQEQDPTAEDFNQLVATDGGEIKVSGCGAILALVPIQNGILVMADNGVWSIHGGDAPFTAINYSVDKVHSSGLVSATGVVDVDGAVLFAARDGVYALTKELGGFKAVSVTDTNIKSFYQDISPVAKSKILAVYSKDDRRVYFLYGNATASDQTLSNVLAFDMQLGAWFPLQIASPTGGPAVISAFDKRNFSDVTIQDVVTVSSVPVTVGGVEVYVSSAYSGVSGAGLKLVTAINAYRMTFSELNSHTLKDWYTFDSIGTDYSAYAEVGPITLGELLRDKQATYITTYLSRTEDGYVAVSGGVDLANKSSCMISAKWGWSDSTASGRWTTPQQAYKLQNVYIPSSVSDPFDYGYSVVKSKTLLRGNGRAVTVRFEAEAGKDMQLLGWAVPIQVNGAP